MRGDRQVGRPVPFCSRAPEQNGGPNLRRAGHGIGGAHYPISLSAHCLLPWRFPRRALGFAGPLRTAPAPNATGPAPRLSSWATLPLSNPQFI